jgi:cobalt-zinc-cadmium efflux system outer membrane protein
MHRRGLPETPLPGFREPRRVWVFTLMFSVIPHLRNARLMRRLVRSSLIMNPRPFLLISVLGIGLGGCVHFVNEPIKPEETAAVFDRRNLGDPGLLSFLNANNLPTAPDQGWDVDRLTFAAFYYQPALAEVRGHLAATRAAIKTARQVPNPNLTITPSYDRQPTDAPTPWSLQPVSFDVPIETMGKRRYRTEQAQHIADAEAWNLNAGIWQVRVKVRASLLTLYIASERRGALGSQASSQSEVARLMEGQMQAGALSGYELTQARIGFAAQRLAAQDGAALYAQALTDLANTVGVPRAALEQAKFSFASFQSMPPPLDVRALRAEALRNRADVQAALAQYAAAQSTLQLEIANQYPDIHLGPAYQWNANQLNDNMYQLAISFNLPIFNHNQGPVAEALAKRKEAAAHFLTVQATAISEIDGAIAAYAVAMSGSRVAETLAVQLQSRRRSTAAMERVGEVDPLTARTAEVEYYNGVLMRLDALSRAQLAYGTLEDALENPAALSESARRAAAQSPSLNP